MKEMLPSIDTRTFLYIDAMRRFFRGLLIRRRDSSTRAAEGALKNVKRTWHICVCDEEVMQGKTFRRFDSGLLELDKHRVDLVESGVDLLPNLCTSENDLAANKDEEHDFGSKHAVDQTREQ